MEKKDLYQYLYDELKNSGFKSHQREITEITTIDNLPDVRWHYEDWDNRRFVIWLLDKIKKIK